MSYYRDVGRFHAQFGIPHYGEDREPHLLSEEDYAYRRDFLREELREFERAHEDGDLEKAFDGLVDLVVVALGTAQMMHLPFDRGWGEVDRANRSKRLARPGDADHKRGAREPLVKPEGWRPPDLKAALDQARSRAVEARAADRYMREIMEHDRESPTFGPAVATCCYHAKDGANAMQASVEGLAIALGYMAAIGYRDGSHQEVLSDLHDLSERALHEAQVLRAEKEAERENKQ